MNSQNTMLHIYKFISQTSLSLNSHGCFIFIMVTRTSLFQGLALSLFFSFYQIPNFLFDCLISEQDHIDAILMGLLEELNPFVMKIYGRIDHPPISSIEALLFRKFTSRDFVKMSNSSIIVNVSTFQFNILKFLLNLYILWHHLCQSTYS